MPLSFLDITVLSPPSDASANANLQYNISTASAEWVSVWSYPGYFSGYATAGASPVSNRIDKFPFATDADATNVASLTVAKVGAAGQSSTTHGYSSGGSTNAPGTTKINTIEKFSFLVDANATDVGDLTETRDLAIGQNSETTGYSSGGEVATPAYVTTIDKFPFAADSNAADVGDLTQARSESASQSSLSHGYTTAGYNSANLNTIDKFSFAADGNATDVGDSTLIRRRVQTGQSSFTHGYTSGGQGPGTGNTNVIDKFPFAADGNASDVGNLTVSIRRSAGQSSTTSGYNSGGFTSADTNRIDKFPFASDAGGVNIADLSNARYNPTGHQI